MQRGTKRWAPLRHVAPAAPAQLPKRVRRCNRQDINGSTIWTREVGGKLFYDSIYKVIITHLILLSVSCNNFTPRTRKGPVRRRDQGKLFTWRTSHDAQWRGVAIQWGLLDGPFRMLREGCSKSGVGLHDGPLRMLKRVIQESTWRTSQDAQGGVSQFGGGSQNQECFLWHLWCPHEPMGGKCVPWVRPATLIVVRGTLHHSELVDHAECGPPTDIQSDPHLIKSQPVLSNSEVTNPTMGLRTTYEQIDFCFNKYGGAVEKKA